MNAKVTLPPDASLSNLSGKRRLRRYPSYCPSGASWIPDVPEGWNTKRLKYSVSFPKKSESRTMRADELVSFVPMEAVGEYGGLALEATKPLEEVVNGYTYFRDEDVLVAKITPCFENGKGALAEGLVGGVGFGTTELHVLRAGSGLTPRFLFYITLGDDFRNLGASEMYGAGGQKRVPESFLKELRHPIPPLEEQETIVAFLDRETARIDALVAKKERLIELLQEKRTALISHAVTKGLNPDAKMKESGNEWVGDVPRHWTVAALRHVARLQTGLTLGKKYAEDQMLTSRPYLRVANVQDGYLDLDEITEVEIPPSDVSRYELEPGDVLMTEGGDFDKLGRGYVWENQIPNCLHQNHIFAVRPTRGRLHSHFLSTLLASLHGKNYFTSTSSQSTNLASTNSTKLKQFPVLLPSVKEQEAILDYVGHRTAQLEVLVSKAREGIDRLREYRTALISAAVTGKIDVRKEA